jgi:hypothetical protein
MLLTSVNFCDDDADLCAFMCVRYLHSNSVTCDSKEHAFGNV